MKEKTVISEFCTKAMLNLLEFFTIAGDDEYSKADIARNAGIHYTSLMKLWPKLEEFELVKPGKSVAKIQLYRINKKSKLLRFFNAFSFEIENKVTDKIVAREIAKGEMKKIKVEKAEAIPT